MFRRALVVKLRHHGDVLLSAPVFSALVAAQPGIEVDALVYEETRDMLDLHPHVARVHAIPRDWRRLGVLAQLKRYWRLYRELKARQYDLIVHLTDHWHGARLARLLRPRVSVGPAGTKHSAFANRLWNRSFSALFPVPPGNQRHTVEMHLDALRAIGVRVVDTKLAFHPGAQAADSVAKRLAGRDFILVHPTSRWMFKAWPAASMAELVNALIARGERIVLSAAPSAEERAYIAELKPRLRGDYLDLTGKLTLKELGALVAAARLLIGVDSMPVHLASAVGTPVVVLFGPSGDVEWAPWGVPHRIVTAPFPCRPCGNKGCGDGGVSDCLTAIAPAQVLGAVDALLAEVRREVRT
jgi:heptosyltransferase-3